jgi:hypothetical protein
MTGTVHRLNVKEEQRWEEHDQLRVVKPFLGTRYTVLDMNEYVKTTCQSLLNVLSTRVTSLIQREAR